ncbi:hypothetical protein [Wolbachia endosymbiont of Oedothorax gibbosus]|uniref:hypothetical protein n=1 Tax=Wolbachia endosymbiont of Oedothorax gibbosus TaxID=931100 RepID=UPI0020254AA4|nr:hypothetical protein [Wolbachia endosymbiont of Oedothorax gibbosus]
MLNLFDINEKNEEGDTLLHCAIKYAPMSECRKRFTVLSLTAFGADLGITDADGKTCFDLLEEKRKDDTKAEWEREEYTKILIQATPSTRICSGAVTALERMKTAEERKAGAVFLNKVYNLKDIPSSRVVRMRKKVDTASIDVDKNFLTKIYENVCENTSQIGRTFLDQVYKNICKRIDDGLQMTV